MLAVIQEWVLAIVGTALVCAVVRALAPEGGGKKVVSVVCGFAMLGAVLGIRGAADGASVGDYTGGFTARAEEYARQAKEAGAAQTRFIIEERCRAYILDKAAQLGVTVRDVTVTARWSEEGFWVPVSCSLAGNMDAGLAGAIASELGIPLERQTWSTGDE